MTTSLLPAPEPGSPIKDLEWLWLQTACAYEQFDETLMADTDWDIFARELNDRREEWSPYFRQMIPSEDFNVGTTASGIDWRQGVGRNFYLGLAERFQMDRLGLRP